MIIDWQSIIDHKSWVQGLLILVPWLVMIALCCRVFLSKRGFVRQTEERLAKLERSANSGIRRKAQPLKIVKGGLAHQERFHA